MAKDSLKPKTPRWPVPDSYSKSLPKSGEPGCFWEDRGDRFHCGVDIYAPEGSPVHAVESGTVVDYGLFTDPALIHYWETTFFVDVECLDKLIRYAELGSVTVSTTGAQVSAGDVVGTVGKVLNPDKVLERDPLYIQKLSKNHHLSMLHIEVRKAGYAQAADYRAGNLFQKNQPEELMDPETVLFNF